MKEELKDCKSCYYFERCTDRDPINEIVCDNYIPSEKVVKLGHRAKVKEKERNAIKEAYDLGYKQGYDTGYIKGRTDGYALGEKEGIRVTVQAFSQMKGEYGEGKIDNDGNKN